MLIEATVVEVRLSEAPAKFEGQVICFPYDSWSSGKEPPNEGETVVFQGSVTDERVGPRIEVVDTGPGIDEETAAKLGEAFSLDRVGSSGVQFSMDKLRWFNEQHLRSKSPEALAEAAREDLRAEGVEVEASYLEQVAALMQDRISFARELATDASYFWEEPSDYEERGVKKRWKHDSAELLTTYADRLEQAEAFDEDTTERVLRELAAERGLTTHVPRLAYCMDNAAMIGITAHYKLAAGHTSPLTLTAQPSVKLDASP